ncbi:hypothetical protein SGFS_075330 [Streptomyces graminofaciens]|uniref:Peptide zinc metalloprotease protein n=1 Tax=Streptomyces graminofaciens TaxID=68212 RepID=A0ABN5VSF2_9ACTN|nr:hypothetical protein [Streptomyces graminofaciens]BBC36239.1 hypothetical protein SGFS_075330 [Streptomyces graminofaciens]
MLTEGTELVGEFAGSGYRHPPHLVHRFDGQVIHLPELLYETAKSLERHQDAATRSGGGPHLLDRVAQELTRNTGRAFTADHVAFVLDNKLAPLGITTRSDGTLADFAKADHLFLGLRYRAALISENVSWIIAGIFAWLFQPLLVLLAVSTFLATEIWLFSTENAGRAMAQVMADPAGILIMLGLTLASAAFHEVGHAAACRYGKVRPGVMGCGLYLVWPAFYTDVTSSYRLGRGGRLRTDLGGVYFNSLFVLGLAALYSHSPSPVLLAAILLVNLEMVQQLLPTLRFDGYYIISDLVGIPDLFKYIGPILRRTILRRPAEERLQALKRWPQVVVTIWVLTVLPVLVLQLGMVLFQTPQMATTAWGTATNLITSATTSTTPVLSTAAASVQIFFLLLPLVGILLILWQLVNLAVRLLRKRFGKPAAEPRDRRGHRSHGHGTLSLLLWGALATVGALALAYLLWTLVHPAARLSKDRAALHATGAEPTAPPGTPPADVRSPARPEGPSGPTGIAHGPVSLRDLSGTTAETRTASESSDRRHRARTSTEGGTPAHTGTRADARNAHHGRPEPHAGDHASGPGRSPDVVCPPLVRVPVVEVGVLTICP